MPEQLAGAFKVCWFCFISFFLHPLPGVSPIGIQNPSVHGLIHNLKELFVIFQQLMSLLPIL